MRTGAAALAGLIGAASLCQAQAAEIRFELHGERGTAGVLSGSFYGLADQGVSAPTAMDFTLTPYAGPSTYTQSFGPGQFVSTGGFDIEDGQVTSPGYDWTSLISAAELHLPAGLDGFSGEVFGQSIFSNPADRPSEGGYLTFELVSSAPEPADWALVIAGVATVGLAFRLRRRRLASA